MYAFMPVRVFLRRDRQLGASGRKVSLLPAALPLTVHPLAVPLRRAAELRQRDVKRVAGLLRSRAGGKKSSELDIEILVRASVSCNVPQVAASS